MAEAKNQRLASLPEQNPVLEAAAGTTKLKREMEMGVTVRKGEAPVLHKYIREDK